MEAYCFFCETQRCRMIAAELEKITGCRCISPQIIQSKWICGELTEETHDYLPGYVFLYAEEPIDVTEIERRPRGILRCLGTQADRYALCGADLRFAMMLKAHDGTIGKVKLLEVGDRVRIADECWDGMQGTVTKLDRHRKRCCVSFVFDSVQRTVWVGYELLEDMRHDLGVSDV